MSKYFSFDNLDKASFYFLIGGRHHGMKLRYLSFMCQWLFGGKTEIYYKAMKGCTCIKITNDDIGEMEFELLDETVDRETVDVRLMRMCEEYDGYMRYKFRDYQGDS